MRVWKADGQSNRILHVFDFALSSFDVSADGNTLAAADTAGTVRVLDVETGDEILPRPQSVSGATKVVLSPDEHYLAGGGPGPVVHLWDLQSGEIERRLGQALGPPAVAFVNGGDEILAASLEGIVRGYFLEPEGLWEVASEKAARDLTEGECERFLHRSCG